MRIGSLFSGIGGLELGLERAGLGPVVWQAERDDYCRRVLAMRWPGVRRYADVRDVDADAARVELVCGGFPCQDISDASRGRGGGINGKRSGLWREILRVAGELRPQWILVENVDGGAWGAWVPLVRRALHDRGYASMPLRVSAAAVGAPFPGPRVFVAAANCDGQSTRAVHAQVAQLPALAEPRWQDWGQPTPRALGMADGVPARMDRLRAAGNAVVPQVAEVIGRAIVAATDHSPSEQDPADNPADTGSDVDGT